MTDDLISRRKAIDALMNALNDVGVLDAEDINTVFQMLPPTRLEIVKCKDCKYWNSGYCECPEPVINTEAEHFCGYGDMREVAE